MSEHQSLDVSQAGDVTVVRFVDCRMLDGNNVDDVRRDLFGLVEKESRTKLLLDFSDVEFLSSDALNILILLRKKLTPNHGSLRLCSLCPQIRAVFTITKLDQLFEIKENEREGLEAF